MSNAIVLILVMFVTSNPHKPIGDTSTLVSGLNPCKAAGAMFAKDARDGVLVQWVCATTSARILATGGWGTTP